MAGAVAARIRADGSDGLYPPSDLLFVPGPVFLELVGEHCLLDPYEDDVHGYGEDWYDEERSQGAREEADADEDEDEPEVHWVPADAEGPVGDERGGFLERFHGGVPLFEGPVSGQVEPDARDKRNESRETPCEGDDCHDGQQEVESQHDCDGDEQVSGRKWILDLHDSTVVERNAPFILAGILSSRRLDGKM